MADDCARREPARSSAACRSSRAVWDLTRMARDVCSVLGTTDVERASRHRKRGCRGGDVRRRARPPGHGELRQQRHQVLARRQPGAHLHRERRRPRASRGARPGARACAPEDREKIFEKFGTRRGSTGIELPLRRVGSRFLQTRHRGAWRDHRRGSRRAGRQHVLVRAARVITQRFDRLRRPTGA